METSQEFREISSLVLLRNCLIAVEAEEVTLSETQLDIVHGPPPKDLMQQICRNLKIDDWIVRLARIKDVFFLECDDVQPRKAVAAVINDHPAFQSDDERAFYIKAREVTGEETYAYKRKLWQKYRDPKLSDDRRESIGTFFVKYGMVGIEDRELQRVIGRESSVERVREAGRSLFQFSRPTTPRTVTSRQRTTPTPTGAKDKATALADAEVESLQSADERQDDSFVVSRHISSIEDVQSPLEVPFRTPPSTPRRQTPASFSPILTPPSNVTTALPRANLVTVTASVHQSAGSYIPRPRISAPIPVHQTPVRPMIPTPVAVRPPAVVPDSQYQPSFRAYCPPDPRPNYIPLGTPSFGLLDYHRQWFYGMPQEQRRALARLVASEYNLTDSLPTYMPAPAYCLPTVVPPIPAPVTMAPYVVPTTTAPPMVSTAQVHSSTQLSRSNASPEHVVPTPSFGGEGPIPFLQTPQQIPQPMAAPQPDLQRTVRSAVDSSLQSISRQTFRQNTPKIRTFTGSTPTKSDQVTYDQWVHEIRTYRVTHPEPVVKEAILRSAAGDALDTLNGLDPDATLDELLDRMKLYYGGVDDIDVLQRNFYNVGQKDTETVSAFASRLETTARKMNERFVDAGMKISQKQIRERLFYGLKEKLRNIVRHAFDTIPDYNAFLRNVRRAEGELEAAKPVSRKQPEDKKIEVKSKSSLADYTMTELKEALSESVLSQVNQVIAQQATTVKTQAPRSGTSPSGGGKPRSTTPISARPVDFSRKPDVMDSHIRCYKCHGFGHRPRDCPTKKSEKDAGQGHPEGVSPPQGTAAQKVTLQTTTTSTSVQTKEPVTSAAVTTENPDQTK